MLVGDWKVFTVEGWYIGIWVLWLFVTVEHFKEACLYWSMAKPIILWIICCFPRSRCCKKLICKRFFDFVSLYLHCICLKRTRNGEKNVMRVCFSFQLCFCMFDITHRQLRRAAWYCSAKRPWVFLVWDILLFLLYLSQAFCYLLRWIKIVLNFFVFYAHSCYPALNKF